MNAIKAKFLRMACANRQRVALEQKYTKPLRKESTLPGLPPLIYVLPLTARYPAGCFRRVYQDLKRAIIRNTSVLSALSRS